MTRYWPLSVLKNSPLMPPAYQWELLRFTQQLPSAGAYYACIEVTKHAPAIPMPGLVVIETVNGTGRFMYTEYPDFEAWARLERVGAIEGMNGFMCMVMDALH